MKKHAYTILFFLFLSLASKGAHILIPMDNTQSNHLKAYGIAYWVLQNNVDIEWLLNYRGGSFLMRQAPSFEKECAVRGVTYQVIADVQAQRIRDEITDPEINMEIVKLEKAPKIAVYSPKTYQPWDDAVTLAMTYSEIPYEVVYDEDIMLGKLPLYDWLHLHHEDFTGQFGKFYAAYQYAPWYKEQVRTLEALATKLGFKKVSQLKLAVSKQIRDFVAGGGYLFAMCSAPDSYDIALAADGVDICENMFDGDPADANFNNKLDFGKCFSFQNFLVSTNPMEYKKSNIDATYSRGMVPRDQDVFSLFEFSAKWDPIPTMLCQNHETIIKGFMGQTTSFVKKVIKPEVLIMGENKSLDEAKYIHGTYGNGTFTFYGGHDPEDYQHMVGDPPTDLNLHPNSPGYRLILNNILFPAAKKKKQKT